MRSTRAPANPRALNSATEALRIRSLKGLEDRGIMWLPAAASSSLSLNYSRCAGYSMADTARLAALCLAFRRSVRRGKRLVQPVALVHPRFTREHAPDTVFPYLDSWTAPVSMLTPPVLNDVMAFIGMP